MKAISNQIKVVAQLTILPKTVSLIAEEDHPPFAKGQVVKRISRDTLDKMKRPLSVIITTGGGGISNTQITVRPDLIKQQELKP